MKPRPCFDCGAEYTPTGNHQVRCEACRTLKRTPGKAVPRPAIEREAEPEAPESTRPTKTNPGAAERLLRDVEMAAEKASKALAGINELRLLLGRVEHLERETIRLQNRVGLLEVRSECTR